jgi:dethiobiotin synthetase
VTGVPPRGFFVTGTDTGVGKTRVAVALIHGLVGRGLRVAGMKPIASGCRLSEGRLVNDDALALRAAANTAVAYSDVNPYAFEPAIAPHVAARQAGVTIERSRILQSYRTLSLTADAVVVEGAGGWLVPIGSAATMADVARDLCLPVVLVVAMRLGCINHALLTAGAISTSGLLLAGWIANDPGPAMPERTASVNAIRERIGAPQLADHGFGAGSSAIAIP